MRGNRRLVTLGGPIIAASMLVLSAQLGSPQGGAAAAPAVTPSPCAVTSTPASPAPSPSLVASPSPVVPPSPVASASVVPSPVASTSPTPTPVGPLTWVDTRPKGFAKGAYAARLTQDAAGMVFAVGYAVDKTGQLRAAGWSSSDGRRWVPQKLEAPAGSQASAVVTTDSGLIAVGSGGGSGLVWTSTDGASWVSGTLPLAIFQDVLVTAAGPIVVGDAGAGYGAVPTIWTATGGDPTAWQPTPIGERGFARRLAVSQDGVLVAAGFELDDNCQTHVRVWRSTDGTIWTTVGLEGFPTDGTLLNALKWTSVGFVMAISENAPGGAAGSIWLSQDGSAWNKTLDVPDGVVSTLSTVGTEVIAFGADRTWRSADGITWEARPVPVFKGAYIDAITPLSDGRLLAAGVRAGGGNTHKVAMFAGVPAPSSAP